MDDKEYGCSYSRLEELHDFYFEKYCDLKQENQQLKIQISAREEEYRKLEKNWNELKELIDVKLYNTEYLQKLCGYRIDDVNHLILKIIKNKMQELEKSDSNE